MGIEGEYAAICRIIQNIFWLRLYLVLILLGNPIFSWFLFHSISIDQLMGTSHDAVYQNWRVLLLWFLQLFFDFSFICSAILILWKLLTIDTIVLRCLKIQISNWTWMALMLVHRFFRNKTVIAWTSCRCDSSFYGFVCRVIQWWFQQFVVIYKSHVSRINILIDSIHLIKKDRWLHIRTFCL